MRVDIKGSRTVYSVIPVTVSVNGMESPELPGSIVCKTSECMFFEKIFRPSKDIDGLLFNKSSEKVLNPVSINVAHCTADEQSFEPHLILDPPEPNHLTQHGTCQVLPRPD